MNGTKFPFYYQPVFWSNVSLIPIFEVLGILTSMFSAVLFSRGLVNLWYGRQKKLKSVSIGQVWKPGPDATSPTGDNDLTAPKA